MMFEQRGQVQTRISLLQRRRIRCARNTRAAAVLFFGLVACGKADHSPGGPTPSAVQPVPPVAATDKASTRQGDASVGVADQHLPDSGAGHGICARMDLLAGTLRKMGGIFEYLDPDGFPMGTYRGAIEEDLNGDGMADRVVSLTTGCSRSGGCEMYVLLNCGDGSYGKAAFLNYAKGVEVDPKRRKSERWLDLWLLTGDRDASRPNCYVETRTHLRWRGQSYESTPEVKNKRTCEHK